MRSGHQYDVIIAGGGPAGSGTAIRLARSGLSVLLVEQKQFPRAKLCGEFISPECLSQFAELGVLEAMQIDASPIERTVFYARNGSSVPVPSEWLGASSAIGLSRAEMDARLLDRARAVGVNVLEDIQVTGLVFDSDRIRGVSLRGGAEAIAPITIDATGKSRALVREAEDLHGKQRRTRADHVAFKAHLTCASVPPGDCEIYGYRSGYGGCSQVENGLHNLCFIVSSEIAKLYRGNAEAIMTNVLFANRRAKQSLQNARVAGEWLAVPIESYGRAGLAPAVGLLTVGDAAGFIDPFTGSGILLALESGKILAGVVAAAFARSGIEAPFATLTAEYEQQYHSAFDRRLRISSLVRRAAFAPILGEVLVRTLALSGGMTRLLARATRQNSLDDTASSFPQERGRML